MEAALLCPLLCLVLCLLVSMTLVLYEQVAQYGEDCLSVLEETRPPSMLLRMERAAGSVWKEFAR